MEGPTQEHNLALDFPPLNQPGNGLIHHCLINTGSYVAFVSALVQQRLNIRFGKHAAAGGNGINPIRMLAGFVHFIHGHVQQHSHLVNKSACTAGTGTIHSFIHTALEEDHLGVLAPKLDDHPGIRGKGTHAGSCGIHFLGKENACSLCSTQTCRTGNGHREGLLFQQRRHIMQHVHQRFPDAGKMPLITLENHLLIFHQHQLGGGGANIDPKGSELFLHHHLLLTFFIFVIFPRIPSDREWILSNRKHDRLCGFHHNCCILAWLCYNDDAHTIMFI